MAGSSRSPLYAEVRYRCKAAVELSGASDRVGSAFGGVLRDMVCNEIPKAFKDHRPYAVCSFAGGWTYVALWSVDSPGWIALLGCLVVTVGLRALALWRNW